MNLILPCAPGCCEQDECEIAADDFNRTDADDINTGAPVTWSGDNSNIWVASNAILFFSGTAEALTCGTAHPDSVKSAVVQCTFTGFSDGEECEVFLNATDDQNCTVARMTTGASGTLEIFARVAGVDTLLASLAVATVTADPNILTLLYDADSEVAQAFIGVTATPENSVCTQFATLPQVGGLAGISLGSNSGGVYADDFVYQHLGDGVNGCPQLVCCDIASDDFNRSDSTSTGSSWTETSGDWSIASNTLQVTGNGLIIHDATTFAAFIIEVDFKQSETFASACVVFGYQDSSNYLMAQFDVGFGGSRIWLYEIAGGTPTVLRQRVVSMLINTTYSATICVNENGDIAISLDGVLKILYEAATFPDYGIGLRAIASTGTATFDNFAVYVSQSEGHEGCDPCTNWPPLCGDECEFDDNTELNLIVDLGAGGLTDGDCGFCDEIVGEVTLSRNPSDLCQWVAHVGGGLCATWNVIARLLTDDDGKCFLVVLVYVGGESTGGSSARTYRTQYEVPLSADSLTPTNSPWTLDKSPGHADGYRGYFGSSFDKWFNPGEDWDTICDGSLPATITARLEYP